jgi:NitT/TauT family transport system ATP-binding protein
MSAHPVAASTRGEIQIEKPFVKVEDLRKTYVSGTDSVVHAVRDVTLAIKEGEFTSIVGPSGCGKSTLLMIVAGLLKPTSGRIVIGDTEVRSPQTNLGVVFQRDVLLEWRTVLGNVMLQAEARGMPRSATQERARDLLTSMGLAGFENTYPDALSGGMRQRVSICRALVHDPPLLLMDEPFGALDALTRDQMGLDLLQLWSQHMKTVIFITHDLEEAVFLSDRVVVMTPRPGQIDKIIDIPLDRPRRLEMRSSAVFAELTAEIRESFKQHGVLREHQAQTAAPDDPSDSSAS